MIGARKCLQTGPEFSKIHPHHWLTDLVYGILGATFKQINRINKYPNSLMPKLRKCPICDVALIHTHQITLISVAGALLVKQ